MLITLAIIGIIAALTVPTLMRKYQEHQTVVAVKEAYSILSNAIKMAQVEHGNFNTWNIGEYGNLEDSKKLIYYIAPYLKSVHSTPEYCTRDYNHSIKSLDGTLTYACNHMTFLRLQNGMFLLFWTSGRNSDGINRLVTMVDLNGINKPNIIGQDIFTFEMKGTDNSLYPQGYKLSESSLNNLNDYCNPKIKSVTNGRACSAWAIYKGNMDYLRREVSWDE